MVEQLAGGGTLEQLKVNMFNFNRIIAWLLFVALMYGVLQAWGILPSWAPRLFPRPSEPPAAFYQSNESVPL